MEMEMELQGAGAFLACRSQFPLPICMQIRGTRKGHMHVTDLVPTFRGVNITIHGNQGTKHRLCFASGIVKSWHIHLPASLCDGIWTVPLVPMPPVIAEYRQKTKPPKCPVPVRRLSCPSTNSIHNPNHPASSSNAKSTKPPQKKPQSYWSCGQIQGGKSIESL